MAHLRKHKRSPYWYLRFRDLDTGEWKEESTGLRFADNSDTRRAQRKADAKTVEEQRIGTPSNNPAFNAWVPGYLDAHWKPGSDTRRRQTTAWQALRVFLNAHDILYPRQLRYRHGEDYLRWRLGNPVHGRRVVHNTALVELHFLAQLMNEAVRREYCESNPIARLGIGRRAPKEKRELTDKEIARLRKHLVDQPQWMRTAFEISLYTGCRFSECEMPLENIDLRANSIRICDSKRPDTDRRKFFTVPIHPDLRPTLERLKRSGATVTCRLTRDKNGRINYFIRQSGIKDASFHCLRVTFVTRCHRGGLSESEAMRLVNHSSTLVHRVYSKLGVEDARLAQARIPLPSFDGEKRGPRARSSSSRRKGTPAP